MSNKFAIDTIEQAKQSYNHQWQIASGNENKKQPKIINIQVDFLTDIFQLITNQSSEESGPTIKPIESLWPLTFEQLGLRHGFIYYQHVIDFHPSDPILLNITQLHDRALIFINDIYRATLSRMDMIFTAPLNSLQKGDIIGLLVENQGHTCCSLQPELKVSISHKLHIHTKIHSYSERERENRKR